MELDWEGMELLEWLVMIVIVDHLKRKVEYIGFELSNWIGQSVKSVNKVRAQLNSMESKEGIS